MTGYNFIFSNKPLTKFYRHFIFWFIWWSLYSLISVLRRVEFQNYSYFDAVWLSAFETFIQLPIDMCFCYLVIYFIIPKYLYQEKTIGFLTIWIFAVLCVSTIQFYYIDFVVLPIRKVLGKPVPKQPGLLLSLVTSSISFNVEAGFATAIRLVKRTIQQKKETQLTIKDLECYKDREELAKNDTSNLFLTNILNRINAILMLENSRMSGLLLDKFNFLMNYVAYDFKYQVVAFNREVAALKLYIELHQQIAGNDFLISLRENVDNSNSHNISPLLLIGFANIFLGNEVCIKQGKSVDINIIMTDSLLYCEILYISDMIILDDFTDLSQEQLYNRLRIIYPESFEVKKIIENETLKLISIINLDKIVYR